MRMPRVAGHLLQVNQQALDSVRELFQTEKVGSDRKTASVDLWLPYTLSHIPKQVHTIHHTCTQNTKAKL